MGVTGTAVEVPRVVVTVQPAFEPVPLDDLRSHLRITGTDHDASLAAYLTAARLLVEGIQGTAWVTQTRTKTLDAFPADDGPIELDGAPLQSITSITYTKEDASSGTVSTSTYHTDTATRPGRAVLKVDEEWPDDDLIATGGVVVTYVAGYAPVTAAVTISNATPAVVTWSAHGLANGAAVHFTTTGALPTGITAERTYYVAQAAAGTFQLAASPGGSSIATTTAGSGTHTAVSLWRIPATVKHALKLIVGDYFEGREASSEQQLFEIPSVAPLVNADRIWGFA